MTRDGGGGAELKPVFDQGTTNENSLAEARLSHVLLCQSALGGAGRTGRCASRSADGASFTALPSA
jgi:hypothetical protein